MKFNYSADADYDSDNDSNVSENLQADKVTNVIEIS